MDERAVIDLTGSTTNALRKRSFHQFVDPVDRKLCTTVDLVDDSHQIFNLIEEDRKPAAREFPEISSDQDRKLAAREVVEISSDGEDFQPTSLLDPPRAAEEEDITASEVAVAAAFAAAAAPAVYNVDDDIGFPVKEQALRDDHVLALALQNQEHDLYHKKQAQEDKQMQSSVTGKAWKFVEKLQDIFKPFDMSIRPLAVDDLVYLTERMMVAQEEFSSKTKTPVHVDIGYHYTREENLMRIKTDGLMSKQERDAYSISSQFNGSAFGDGVYTAANPSAYNGRFGDIGIIVARLKGIEKDYRAKFDRTIDSIVVRRQTPLEIVVLEKSYQCLPLVQFSSSLIVPFSNDSPGNKSVYDCHLKLQELIDLFFNGGVPTAVAPMSTEMQQAGVTINSLRRQASLAANGQPPLPMTRYVIATASSAMPSPPLRRKLIRLRQPRPAGAPTRRALCGSALGSMRYGYGQHSPRNCEMFQYEAPQTLDISGSACFRVVQRTTYSILSEECAICLDAMSHHGKVVRLHTCGHHFHKECIEDSLRHSPQCPTCRKLVNKPQGRMPSGTMTISQSPNTTCAGHEPAGSIVIHYNIPAGLQKEYHPNPGQTHASASRIAYLPDSSDGNQLLKRLIFSFLHGLTFTVGTSLTTGRANSVTWGSVHHKTSPRGGAHAHGYPDLNFLTNCNRELDALHVPPADECGTG